MNFHNRLIKKLFSLPHCIVSYHLNRGGRDYMEKYFSYDMISHTCIIKPHISIAKIKRPTHVVMLIIVRLRRSDLGRL